MIFDETPDGKKAFANAVGKLIELEPRSGVENVIYEAGQDREIITIEFKGGTVKKIDVTINSNGANFKEIAAAVYGNGAFGEFTE